MKWHRHVARKTEWSHYRVETLTSKHDLTCFVSSNDELTRYLTDDALADQGNKTSVTHLLLTESDEIVGYFTLLTDSMKLGSIDPEGPLRAYPYRSIPALKIARMSVKIGKERRMLGTLMLSISFSFLFEITRYAGCRIMTVDSKRGCEGFYEKFGFKRASVQRKVTVPMYFDIRAFLEQIGEEMSS